VPEVCTSLREVGGLLPTSPGSSAPATASLLRRCLNANHPHYRPRRDLIEQELEAVDEPVILVGHSFGGSVLLKYLAEGSHQRPVRVCFLSRCPIGGQMAGRMTNSRCQMMLV
jgi:predicted alpha/beta hydrolase family esterase